MGLRETCIDAIAAAIYQGLTGMDDWKDEVAYAPDYAEATRNHAAMILDAVLDTLEAQRVPRTSYYTPTFWLDGSLHKRIDGLLAVLRLKVGG